MLELRTEIEIDAPVEHVWGVLTYFDRFPDWNPFIRRIHGKMQVGSRLDVLIGATGTRPMRFRPTVKAVIPNRELDGWAASRSLNSSTANTSFKSNPRIDAHPVHSAGAIPRSARPPARS